ncbi:MAG: Hsp70 family protein [Synergistaceae bacterium]|jgi:molecular chaperone DnaK|nr:Hsp70 family protein [Synergistaceae bacterium]
MSDSKIFGIDLGTTNSCISVLDNGAPRVIPADGNGVVPSVISVDGGEILVGRKAKNRAAAFPEQSVRSVKRRMGTGSRVSIGGKSYNPEDISAMILRYLCDEAMRLEGHKVSNVVITVPAYFSDAQRRATIEAGKMAGLTVERIINEPTAAALFYDHINIASGASAGLWKYALVYDLGGGTFDVSVLRMSEIIEVLASTGDTKLGGDDFDRCVVDRLLGAIAANGGADVSEFTPALARLSAIAEQAKMELSVKATVRIEEANIPTPDGHGCTLLTDVSRNDLEVWTSHLLERTVDFVRKALDEAKLHTRDIDKVLLVGGMTRMPVVTQRLTELFGDASMPAVDPDLSVAFGAAIQGGIINGENVEQILLDVTSHTLSLGALDIFSGMIKCAPIIPRNTQIPATRARLFWTVEDRQKIVELDVYQGESELPEENTCIGRTRLELAKAESHSPIEVEYSYDLNGIIHLTAEQKGFSKKVEVYFDSRNPEKEYSQELDDDWPDDLDELDELDEPDEPDAPSTLKTSAPPVNFVTHRAKTLLDGMSPGPRKTSLADLLKRYESALVDDADDIDDIEDELLSAMDES